MEVAKIVFSLHNFIEKPLTLVKKESQIGDEDDFCNDFAKF